jgi:putative oxidoreductase
MMITRILATWYLRLALAASFAFSLADRFGWLGKHGTPGVTWGSWKSFLGSSAQLTFWLPAILRPTAALVSTILEAVLVVALIVPYRTTFFGILAGALLTTYALSLAFAYGLGTSLAYSVWTVAAGGFLLAALACKKAE